MTQKNQPTFLVYLRQLFEMFGPDDMASLQELDTILSNLIDEPIAIQHESWRRCIEILAGFPRAAELAFQLGSQIPITAFIPLAIPIRFAPTIQKMLWFISRYYQLQAPLMSLRFSETDSMGSLELDFRLPVSEEAESFSVASAVSILDYELSHITGKRRNIQQVNLRQQSNLYTSYYQEFLGITPKFQHDTNQIQLQAEVLSKGNPLSDPATFEKYIEHYETELNQNFRNESVSALIKDLLYSHISNPPALAEAARLLKLSERQLRFALSKEDTNFRELLQSCRMEYAIEHLKNPRLPISQVAYKLGYNDLAAFNHGFKRWTGKTPSEYQKTLKKRR